MASRARNRVLTTSGADAPLDLARRIALIEKRGPGRATAEERGADVAPSIPDGPGRLHRIGHSRPVVPVNVAQAVHLAPVDIEHRLDRSVRD